MVQDFVNALDNNDPGKAFLKTNEIDNLELIKVNKSIRNHPIEKIGASLREAMTAMKVIKTEE